MTHPISDMMDASMEKIRTMADANTVIGDPITTGDGTTIIPVSRVKFGFAGGGSEFTTKTQNQGQSNPFGGGTGATVTVTPVAFLINKEGSVRMLPVPEPAESSLDRLLELVPGIVDKIYTSVQEKKDRAD